MLCNYLWKGVNVVPDKKPIAIRIGKRIKALRKQQGLTQDELAGMIDAEWTGTTLSHYEAGDREMRLSTFLAIADALDVSLDALTGRVRQDGAPEGYGELSEDNRAIIGEMVQVLLRRQSIKSA